MHPTSNKLPIRALLDSELHPQVPFADNQKSALPLLLMLQSTKVASYIASLGFLRHDTKHNLKEVAELEHFFSERQLHSEVYQVMRKYFLQTYSKPQVDAASHFMRQNIRELLSATEKPNHSFSKQYPSAQKIP